MPRRRAAPSAKGNSMEVERERLKLRDDPKVISPPIVDPAWQCGTAVVVRGFIANAKLMSRSRRCRRRRLTGRLPRTQRRARAAAGTSGGGAEDSRAPEIRRRDESPGRRRSPFATTRWTSPPDRRGRRSTRRPSTNAAAGRASAICSSGRTFGSPPTPSKSAA